MEVELFCFWAISKIQIRKMVFPKMFPRENAKSKTGYKDFLRKCVTEISLFTEWKVNLISKWKAICDLNVGGTVE